MVVGSAKEHRGHSDHVRGTGESGLVELKNGTIYHNSRTHMRPGNRRIAYGKDAGETWYGEHEEPRARDWLERISEGSVEWFHFGGSLLDNKPPSFDAEGGFYESVNYASFAVSQYLLFRLA